MLSFLSTLLALLAAATLFSAWIVYYRLVLHPLARFPGPKLAAATMCYEMYFDIVKGGQYIWEIKRLHQIYGPVVRITPHELHVLDPDFYDEIYAGPTRKRNRHRFAVANIPGTILGAETHAEHRRRRQVYNPFFSKASIRRFQPEMVHKLERLVERIDGFRVAGEVLNIRYAIFAYTLDLISLVCLGDDWAHLEEADFGAVWVDATMAFVKSFKILTHFKWLHRTIKSLPTELVGRLSSRVALMLHYEDRIRDQVRKVMNIGSASPLYEKKAPSSMFAAVRDDSSVPEDLRSVEQLTRDAMIFIGAGEATTAGVLFTTIFHLLDDPSKLERLRAELEATATANGKSNQHLTCAEVEHLPYLTACLKEGMRLHNGVTKRLPRIAPHENLVYGDMVIPAGTPVSMIQPLVHLHEGVFPEPRAFKPERWLFEDEISIKLPPDELERRKRHLNSKLVAFNRGSMSCIGQEMAWAELFLTLPALVRTFDFELFETDIGDVELRSDWVVLHPKPGSKGVRVRVTGRHDVEFGNDF